MGGTCIFGWMEPGGSHFDKEAARLLLKIAKHDCGLIIPGIAPVKDMLGGKWLYQNKKKFAELKDFMDEIHATGAKMFVQMTAGFGRSFALTAPLAMLAKNKALNTLAKPYIDAEYLTAAPSVLPNRWADDVTTRAITEKEIKDIIFAFGETARLCKENNIGISRKLIIQLAKSGSIPSVKAGRSILINWDGLMKYLDSTTLTPDEHKSGIRKITA
jgi:2-enoate reductase